MFTLSVFGEDLLGREKRPWKSQHFSSFRGMGDGVVGTVLLCCVCVCVPAAAAVLVSGFGFGIRTNDWGKRLTKRQFRRARSPGCALSGSSRADSGAPVQHRGQLLASAPRTAPSVHHRGQLLASARGTT